MAALVLSGCTSVPNAPEQLPPVLDGVPDELLGFYDQTLAWGACDQESTSADVECAEVTAPLDWHDPDRGEISIAIVRPADRPASPVGSLLVNPGGPGGAGVEYVMQMTEFEALRDELTGAYDVVGFDPRGVGRSTAVECLDADRMDDYLYGVPEAERGSDEWDAALTDAAAEYAEACGENSGELLEFITTEQAARDMDLLRAVLGDHQLAFLGYSYGTYLGAIYAELFPENVGRFVLDGALDPSVPGSEVGLIQLTAFEATLERYIDSCLAGSSCPFRGTTAQALDEVKGLLASLDAKPLRAADGRLLGADTLATAILQALYSPDYWPYLTQALAGVQQGSADGAMFLADVYNGRETGAYASNATEAFNAYNCMDYPPEDTAVVEASRDALLEQAPIMGPYLLGADPCEFWPFPPAGERAPIEAAGTPPILVIGTTGDPATPFEWAEALADQLSGGVLVAYEGEGHTAYGGESECIDETVESFLIDGVVPDDGLVCTS